VITVSKPKRKKGEGRASAGKTERPRPDATDDAPAGPEPAAPPTDLELLTRKAAERDEFLERMQRMKADTQNFKNRLAKDFETQRAYATQGLVTDLLPVLDNLDRAIEAAEKDSDGSGLLDGVRLVRQQALKVLANHGVEPIPALGGPFDPAEHEAVMQMPSESHRPGTVIEEVQKGYRMKERVVRPSKVIVAAPPPEPAPDQAAQPDDQQAEDPNQE